MLSKLRANKTDFIVGTLHGNEKIKNGYIARKLLAEVAIVHWKD